MTINLDYARRAVFECGLSVLPPREDGTKAPVVVRDPETGEWTWDPFKEAPASLTQLVEWYADGREGIGVACGKASGNLEVLDFDAGHDTYKRYREAARGAGLAALLGCVEHGYGEKTPHGVHLLYRCDTVSGNLKLAARPKRPEEMRHPNDKVQALIETRGQGGFIIMAPTSGHVNPDGIYECFSGDLATIATITAEERESLHDLARTFDQMPRPEYQPPSQNRYTRTGDRPGDVFNERTSWAEILEPHGWEFIRTRGDESYWRRPGSQARHHHATTNHGGSDLLWVFSTSTEFDTDKSYSKFAAYVLLNHNGDFQVAARELANRGYGERPAEPKKPKQLQSAPASKAAPKRGTAHIEELSMVTPQRVRWLWPAYIPLGKVTVIDGDPGLGKSLVTVDLAARVSTGKVMPDGATGDVTEPAGVVFLTAEDDLADTVVPRLMIAGGDCTRVAALKGVTNPDNADDEWLPTVEDIDALREVVTLKAARLVVIDPLMAHLPGDVNSYRDQDIRRVLRPVEVLAQEMGAAVVFVRHLNKATGARALYRGGGSIGIVGAARSALLVAEDPDDEDRRILASLKPNVSKKAAALAYRVAAKWLPDINDEVPYIVWEGPTTHTADALLGPPISEDERSALDQACSVLDTILADGPVPTEKARKLAREAGVSDRTMDRARAKRATRSERVGGVGDPNAYWQWVPAGWVPKDAKNAEERQPGDMEDLGNIGALRGRGHAEPETPKNAKSPNNVTLGGLASLGDPGALRVENAGLVLLPARDVEDGRAVLVCAGCGQPGALRNITGIWLHNDCRVPPTEPQELPW